MKVGDLSDNMFSCWPLNAQPSLPEPLLGATGCPEASQPAEIACLRSALTGELAGAAGSIFEVSVIFSGLHCVFSQGCSSCLAWLSEERRWGARLCPGLQTPQLPFWNDERKREVQAKSSQEGMPFFSHGETSTDQRRIQ